MKRVFLINFSSPILVAAAEKMQADGIIDIVYWQGYREGFEMAKKNNSLFSNTIFHHVYDAIKGIPPAEVDISGFRPIDKNVIEQCYEYGWQALAMLGRSDYLDSTLVKKRAMYYQYLRFWQGMLERYRPDYILFYDIPHGADDFALYGLAKALKIKTLMMHPFSIDNRLLIMGDYKEASEALRAAYERERSIPHGIGDLPLDLRTYYEKHTQPGLDATPAYYKRSMQNRAPFHLPTLKTFFKHLRHFSIFKVANYYLQMLFTRRQAGTIHPDERGIAVKWRMLKWQRQNKLVRREYENLQIMPDMNKKFVYFPLHLQPEQSTLPMGGVYDDQLLAIEMVAKVLPKDWVLYVKETPLQWQDWNTNSRLYRYPGYYQAITKLPNVFLVPNHTSSFELIARAQAVATITGTAGWEAILRSKPTLVFGYNWYMHCEGAIPIRSFADCKAAMAQIADGFAPSSQAVINFLAALGQASVLAPQYKARRTSGFAASEEATTVNNVCQMLSNNLI